MASGRKCAINNCPNNYRFSWSYFTFPKYDKEPERYSTWAINCSRPDILPENFDYNQGPFKTPNVRVCRAHFEDDMFTNAYSKERLKCGAIPTIFLESPSGSNRDSEEGMELNGDEEESNFKQETSVIKQEDGENLFVCPIVEMPNMSQNVTVVSPSENHILADAFRAKKPTAKEANILSLKRKLHSQKSFNTALKKKNKALKASLREIKKGNKCCDCDKKIAIDYVTNDMNAEAKSFITSQIMCHKQKTQGKKNANRYSEEDKNFIMSLFFCSAKTYNLFERIFIMPSRRTIAKWVTAALQHQPGFDDAVFRILKLKVHAMTPREKVVSLLIGDMVLKNSAKETDENFKELGQSPKALVFLIRGMNQTWSQAIGYFYSHELLPDIMPNLVSLAVEKLVACGLEPKAVILEPNLTNQRLVDMLGVSMESPIFQIGNRSLFVFWDVPFLIKTMFMKLKIQDFNVNGKPVMWKYMLDMITKERKQHKSRLVPKLGSGWAKLSKHYPMQVFSHSTAVAMYTYISQELLPPEANHTAKFIDDIDKLFDCFNSSMFNETKSYRRPLRVTTLHWKFLEEMKAMFEESIPLNNSDDQIFCQREWIHNINAVKLLVWELNVNFKFQYLMTNALNIEPLQKFFSMVVARGPLSTESEQKGEEEEVPANLIDVSEFHSLFSTVIHYQFMTHSLPC